MDIKTIDGNNVGIFHEYTSNGHLNVDAQGTQNLNLGTLTSGSVISIGNAVSETTINDNLTITGNMAVNGTSTITGRDTLALLPTQNCLADAIGR